MKENAMILVKIYIKLDSETLRRGERERTNQGFGLVGVGSFVVLSFHQLFNLVRKHVLNSRFRASMSPSPFFVT